MKTYLIIGASSGIGKALASRLAEKGHHVFATYNKNEIQDTKVKAISFDVLQDKPLDLSVLPASLDGFAYMPGAINLKPFARTQVADFKNDYDLQVVGAVSTLQTCLPLLKNASSASVVFCSTVAVQTGFPFHSIVSSSKGAIEGLTRALAAELAPSIRVNAVAPSITDTNLAKSILNTEEKKQANAQRHPLRKIGTPDDIAAAIEFLLSDDSKWMTGQILHVDGGIGDVKS